ncbi:hypothetical protein QYF36_009799 [Acer negundo]|nr:hypothetical protein QYF36_009799 [Acer negundo]
MKKFMEKNVLFERGRNLVEFRGTFVYDVVIARQWNEFVAHLDYANVDIVILKHGHNIDIIEYIHHLTFLALRGSNNTNHKGDFLMLDVLIQKDSFVVNIDTNNDKGKGRGKIIVILSNSQDNIYHDYVKQMKKFIEKNVLLEREINLVELRRTFVHDVVVQDNSIVGLDTRMAGLEEQVTEIQRSVQPDAAESKYVVSYRIRLLEEAEDLVL